MSAQNGFHLVQRPGLGTQPGAGDPPDDRGDPRDALGQSEAQYRRLVETSQEGVWTIDLEGRTTFVNARMAELLGYTPGEMIGHVHTDFMWPEDRPQGDDDMELRRQGTRAVWDQRYRRKDGTELWTIASCSSLIDDDGRVIGALGMFTDISDRKRAEKELHANQQMMRVALRAAKAGVWSWNARTNEISWSAEQYALFGMDPHRPVSFAEWQAVAHPQDRDRMLRFADSLRQSPHDARTEFRVVTPAGERWILAVAQLEPGTQGDAVRFVGMNLDITDQKMAEIKIRESEARYKALADSTPDGFSAFDRDLRYVYWNKAAEQMTGVSAEQVLGKTREEVWGDTEAVRLASAKLRECLETRTPILLQAPTLAKGRAHCLEIRIVPTPDGVASFLRDVTGKRQAEEEMQRLYDEAREEKNRLSLVLNNIIEEVWFHDADGRVILANPAAQKAFGKVEGREINNHAASIEIFHPDGTPRRVDENPIVRALTGEEIRDLEELVKLPVSGELRTRLVTSIPAHGPDGTVLGVVSVVRDVTERSTADRALALNRARLDYATRLSGVGFWYCDLPFDELQWDERVKDHFFSEPEARITIDDFYARIHEEDRERTRDAIDASIRDHAPYDIVFRTVHPTTGEIKWVRALGGTDYASDGTATHFDGVTVDVSAQKLDQQRLANLNLQLLEQDRRKDEFIATLSHELRNPLAPIRAAAKVIASPHVASPQLQQAQAIIERQVTHMALLLDDLLDIARITQGKLQLKKETVALIDVVDAAVEAVRPTLNGKHHQLSLSLPSEPVVLDADSLRLSQILSNLLMNAAKYSDAGSHIEVSACAEDETLTLSVKDDGIGIAPELITGIFDMFSQLEGVAGRSDGGLGIGLALVKGLTELHGGTVEAHSAGLGLGSEFIVRLPLAPQRAATAPVVTDSAPAASARRRILIADDNQDAAESLAMLLELAGHEVRVAHLGQAAVSLAQVFRPNIALLDIGMPDLSGYEVAQLLRKEPWATGIQLIAVTGWGQENDRRRALEAGFDRHLTKPIDPHQLEEFMASQFPPGGTLP